MLTPKTSLATSSPTTKKKKSFALWGLFIIILTMTATIIAIMVLYQPNSSTLDIRQQAMVENGNAELNTYPFDQSTLKVGTKQTLQLQVNTKSQAVNAIELQFEIIADKNLLDASQIKFEGSPSAALEVNKQEITKSNCEKDCYIATLLLTSKDSSQPYSTHDQMVTLSSLTFTPKNEGSLQLKISQDSQILSSENNTDILDTPSVIDFQYYVTENGIDPAQCAFQYSDWSSCVNNVQTRQFSVQPANCQWYKSETLQELSRACTSSQSNVIKANSNYFYTYTPQQCWYAASDGSDAYILWNKAQYADITWVDVSTSADFGSFYHKQVSGNIDQTSGDYLIMKANNFSPASGGDKALAFEPNQEYFFRLYRDNGTYIASARFYMTYCSGAEKQYRSCNEQCGSTSDDPNKACASGLTCSNNVCRRTGNIDDSRCLPVANSTSSIPSKRGCNDYCSDNSECNSGLTCFWNRCRLTNNVENSSCQAPTPAVTTNAGTTTTTTKVISTTKVVNNSLLPSEAYDLTTYACNHGCNSNRDCDNNLRCYKGSCRLATNPESTSCSGNVTSTGANATASANASNSSQTSTSPAPTTSAVPSSNQSSNPTVLQQLLNHFNWQWLAIAGGLIVLAIAFLVFAVSHNKKNPWNNAPKTSTAYRPTPRPNPSTPTTAPRPTVTPGISPLPQPQRPSSAPTPASNFSSAGNSATPVSRPLSTQAGTVQIPQTQPVQIRPITQSLTGAPPTLPNNDKKITP